MFNSCLAIVILLVGTATSYLAVKLIRRLWKDWDNYYYWGDMFVPLTRDAHVVISAALVIYSILSLIVGISTLTC